MRNKDKKKIVKKAYAKIATEISFSCCSSCGCWSTYSPTIDEISKNTG